MDSCPANKGLWGGRPPWLDSSCGLSDFLQIISLARDVPELIGLRAPAMAKAYDDDLEFHRAIEVDAVHSDPDFVPSTSATAPIVEAYRATCERARAMIFTPVHVAFWSSMYQEAVCGGRVGLGLEWSDASQDETEEMRNARYEAAQRFFNRRRNIPKEQNNDDTWKYGVELLRFVAGASFTHRGRTGEELNTSSGLESILGAMIMLTYAAYETLAGDLWIAALNKDTSAAAAWLEKNGEKSIKLSEFAGYGFDMANKMGTVLTQSSGKVKFQSLSDIRNAYSAAFKGRADLCFEPVADLIVTEKCRHNLAHRGGVVDAELLKTIGGHPDFPDATVGVQIPLNGPNTQRRLMACHNSAMALVKFVDRWLNDKGLT